MPSLQFANPGRSVGKYNRLIREQTGEGDVILCGAILSVLSGVEVSKGWTSKKVKNIILPKAGSEPRTCALGIKDYGIQLNYNSWPIFHNFKESI